MMASIDGRIASGKGRRTGEWRRALNVYNEYCRIERGFRADAWVCGRVTAEAYSSGKNTKLPSLRGSSPPLNNLFLHKKGKNYAVVVDAKGRLRWKSNSLLGSRLVILVTESTPKKYLGYLAGKEIPYLASGKSEIDFPKAFRALKSKLGIKKLLLEGGGKLNGSVLGSGLVSEISLLILPFVVGSTSAPSVFEAKPLSRKELPKRFRLFDVKRLGHGIVWAKYKR